MKTVFPEDLSVLSLEDLETLRVAGLAEFDLIVPADQAAFGALDDETVATIRSLTAGLRAVTAEQKLRSDKLEELASFAAERESFNTLTVNSGTLDVTDSGDAAADVAPDAGADAPTMTAAADRDADGVVQLAVEPVVPEADKPVAVATGEGLGFAVDTPLTWDQLGAGLDRKVSAFNFTPYEQAAAAALAGKRVTHLKQVNQIAKFAIAIPEDQMLADGAPRGAVRRAIEAARDQKRLKGGSLIASGGWGAPSDISYDRFPKLSSRDGLATFPKLGVQHGGVQLPHGSTFAGLFASNNFLSFSEADDIAGKYAPGSGGNQDLINVPGSKPVYRIPATTWVDFRLRVSGIQIQTGILNNRGYPEGVSEEVAMVLDAHEHVVNAMKINAVVAGSTAITMTAAQLGSVAPTLTAVELQVLHYRDTHRMGLDTVLEAKFPFWIKGAFRSDLSRRLGVALLDVSDADINSWFALRGVSLEYVYDWQSIAPTSPFIQFPTTVTFLLYAAGTWIEGTSDVISLDSMYDSTLLATNDFTVLFTEQGWFMAKAGPDSRVITTSISSTGATHIGDEISNTGAL